MNLKIQSKRLTLVGVGEGINAIRAKRLRFPHLKAVTLLMGLVSFYAGVVAAQDAATIREFKPGFTYPLALTKDGRHLAFVSAPVQAGRGGTVTTSVQDLTTGKCVQLPGVVLLGDYMPSALPIAWSPSGRFLAYCSARDGDVHLRIWDRMTNDEKICEARPICTAGSAMGNIPQWEMDESAVYFLSERRTLNQTGRQPSGFEEKRHRLLFKDEANDGITVLASKPASKAQLIESPSPLATMPTIEIVRYSRLSSEAEVFLTGARISRLFLSPDGKTLLAIADVPSEPGVRQAYKDFYFLPLGDAPVYSPASSEQTGEANQAVDGTGRIVRPEISKVRQWIGAAAWAPDSGRIAYLENGALTEGDVMLYERKAQMLRNLTGKLNVPTFSTDGKTLQQPSREARPYDYAWKFGTSSQALTGLAWARDGREIYVMHASHRDSQAKGNALDEIWAVPTGDTRTRNILEFTPGISFFQVLQVDGTAVPSGPTDSFVVAVRWLGENGRYDSGYAVVDPVHRNMTPLTRIEGMVNPSSAMLGGAGGGRTIYFGESPDTPPEGYSVELDSGAIKKVTAFNSPLCLDDMPERRSFLWTSPSGKPGKGLLYLPPASVRRGQAKLPAVVSVYPGNKYAWRENQCIARFRADLLSPLPDLLLAGYAVILPDLEVAGKGETLNGVAADAVSVLDAPALAGVVDVNRVAVIGHSFGGWTVNGLVTRTNRFKAAVSVAGTSDLISLSFHPESGSWAIGGGQARIDQSLEAAFDLYWKESPVAAAGKVETPILLLHGKEDDAVPFEQSLEMFVALRNHGKVATLVGYDGEDHRTILGNPDYMARVKDWIQGYLGRPFTEVVEPN